MTERTFWQFMRPVLWGPGMLVVLGLVFYAVAAGVKRSDDALRADPVRALAEVVSAERFLPNSNQGRPRYEVTLRAPEPGGSFLYTNTVPQPVYDHARGAQAGSGTIEIWQQRDNPRNLRIAVAWDPARPGLDPRWAGAGPLVLAVLVLGWLIWARLPAWRAVSGGDAYDAVVARHRALGKWKTPNTIEWTGRDGKPHTWTLTRGQALPPVGSTVPVVIDPETRREFRADTL